MAGIVVPDEGTWVEGFGDEVIAAAGVAVAVLLVVILLASRKRRRTIHPANAALVEQARRRLGVGDQQENEATGRRPARHARREPCPICLAPTDYAVLTNCGHLFCGK